MLARGTRRQSLGRGGDLLLTAILFLSAAALANPLGNFPLNDDWSYGLTVRRLVEEGTYDPVGWQAMTLLSQVLWGALFSSLFGFSFAVLRISTLALSLVAVWTIYLLTAELGGGRRAATVAALTLGFNPVYFSLSHTFMSDVPFAAFTALAVLLLLRSLKLDSDAYLLWGTFAAVLAVLCRQNGLFVPVAFGVAHIFKHGVSVPRVLKAGLPAVAAAGALLAYQSWLEIADRTPVEYGALARLNISETLDPARLIVLVLAVTVYLGLFLLPALAWSAWSGAEDRRPVSWRRSGIIAGTFLLLVVVLLRGTSPIPPLGNILVKEGIGPLSLRDTYLLDLANVPPLPPGLWAAIGIGGLVGGSVLCVRVSQTGRRLAAAVRAGTLDDHGAGVLFCLVGAAVCLAPLLLVEAVFDRYLLPLVLVLVPVLLSSEFPPASRKYRVVTEGTAGFLIAGFMVFSILATHDYLAWNRVRWTLVADVIENEDIMPSQVDGGFEVNGYYLYAEDYEPVPDASKSWWWVVDDQYIVSFGDVPGYRAERRYEFDRWLPPGRGSVFLLRRAM